jgi:hypothetical protein
MPPVSKKHPATIEANTVRKKIHRNFDIEDLTAINPNQQKQA